MVQVMAAEHGLHLLQHIPTDTREFTMDELAKHDGSDPDGPIYLAIKCASLVPVMSCRSILADVLAHRFVWVLFSLEAMSLMSLQIVASTDPTVRTIRSPVVTIVEGT